MFSCVIFDLDGTLLNTLDDLAAAGNYALASLGLPTYETEKYKYFVGNGIPMLIHRILSQNDNEKLFKKIHKIFSEYYQQHNMDMTRPYDGIAELLQKLKLKGIKIGVATNKDHVFSEKLINTFFGENVDIVCGSRDDIPKKPDPYSVNYIIEKLNVEKNNVLYVGDSSVDMQVAKNAGVVSCGVLWGFRTKEELIENGAVYIAENSEKLYNIVIGEDDL